MPSLDPLDARPFTGYAVFNHPAARPAGFARFSGAWTPAGVCPMRTPDGDTFGYRSGHPAEDLPAAGNIRFTDAHRLTLVLWAAAGANSVSLPLTLTAATDQPPALRVLASAALGIAETVATANPALTTEQTLTLNFTAAAAGRAVLILEWPSRVYTGAVEYGPLSVS